ncbi:Cell Division Cycle 5-Like Protein [Manis pentadactyla]|nr:Cell Division Cycle 5-Like Protein [Manis pentadactyla]KAI5282124.1 Cell Division Cycle 5-Like Protein [Manis pentadactyla]KAI5282125.1 Cell Division Cycle 5-Like Protein [Manis pentadactyla]
MPQHEDEDQYVFRPHIRVGSEIEPTPKPNPRPDPWTRYFTFNIDINNDSLNLLTRSQTCPDIRIVPNSVHNHIFRIDFSLQKTSTITQVP